MSILFSIRDLKVQPHGKCILSITELDLPKKKHIAIIGPNGAGKSTLLKTLLGLKGGKILLNGMTVHHQIKQGAIAWVGQHGKFSLPLTVTEYVQLGCRQGLGWGHKSSKNSVKLNQLLEDFDLQYLAQQRIESLSGGEQQRANIVRALLQNASILLLDEPCNHLDIRHQHRLMCYLRTYRTDFSVIMILHDLTMAANYADFVVLLDKGTVIAAGKSEEVMQPDLLSKVYQWPIKCIRQQDEVFFHMGMAQTTI